MPDNKPRWYPTPIGDLPEGMVDSYRYVATAKWDHSLDAVVDYEALADAYLALEAEVEKLRAVAAAAVALADTPELVGLCDEGDELKRALRDAGMLELEED